MKRIAVLIDCDNISAFSIEKIFRKINSFKGQVRIKKAFGDFSSPYLCNYPEILNKHNIKPEMNITNDKNATDINLTIHSIDILRDNSIDLLFLISGDRDFTAVVTRYIHSGVDVIGIGNSQANNNFKNSCIQFINIEDLNSDEKMTYVQELRESSIKNTKLISKLTKAVLNKKGIDNFANLMDIGQYIQDNYEGFNLNNYGYKKLVNLYKSIEKFEVHYSEDRKKVFVRIRK